MSQAIANLPGTHSRYSAFTFVELEKRTATGVGTYSSVFYRFVNAPQNITYNGAAGFDRPAVGAVFTSRNFGNPTVVQDGNLGNTTQVKFDDFDDVFKILAIANDMLDWRVRIWEMGVDAVWATTYVKLKVRGRSEDQTWDVQQSDDFTLDVGSNMAVQDTAAPRETYSPTCRFTREFKGIRCGYAGINTTCDGQLSTCTSYGNQVRFGGFPDSPTPGTVIGTWGGSGPTAFPSRDAFYPPVRT
jgi:hypothetical protein